MAIAGERGHAIGDRGLGHGGEKAAAWSISMWGVRARRPGLRHALRHHPRLGLRRAQAPRQPLAPRDRPVADSTEAGVTSNSAGRDVVPGEVSLVYRSRDVYPRTKSCDVQFGEREMIRKIKFLALFPVDNPTHSSSPLWDLQLGTTDGNTIGPFAVSRDEDGLLHLTSGAETLVCAEPTSPGSGRPLRDNERAEVELFATRSLAVLADCVVTLRCLDSSEGPEPDHSACAVPEPVHDATDKPSLEWPPKGLDYLAPMNPKLEGYGVIELRQVAEDQFLTPAGYPVRFTGLTPADDEDSGDELFRTSQRQLVRIMHGGKTLTPFFETCRLSIDSANHLAQAAGIRFAKPDYSIGPQAGDLEWMPAIESILILPPPPAGATPGWRGSLFCTLFDGRQVGGIWLSCDSEGQFKCHMDLSITSWLGRTDAAPTPTSLALRNEIRALTLFILPALLKSAT